MAIFDTRPLQPPSAAAVYLPCMALGAVWVPEISKINTNGVKMLKVITSTQAQASLADLIDKVNRDHVIVLIGQCGAADVAMLPAADLSGLLETIYLLRSPMNARRLLSALDRALGRRTEINSTDSKED